MSEVTAQSYEPGTHPDLPAPLLTSGPLYWIKKNLFSSWTNTILTILAFYFLWSAIPPVLDWLVIDSVTEATNRKECKSLGSGACWAFIGERFNILLYGFYPEAERWRVNLSFVLLILAVMPILFDDLPFRRAGLFFAAFYPFIVAWLLLGGPVWFLGGILLLAISAVLPTVSEAPHGKAGPIWYSTLAAIVVLWITFGHGWILIGGQLLAIGILSPILFFEFERKVKMQWYGATALLTLIGFLDQSWLVMGGFGLKAVTTDQFGGMMLNTVVGVTGIAFSLPLGVVLALGRQSHLPVVRMLCVAFIEFIRGVPLITLLFVASTMLSYFLPPGTHFDLLLRVLIMVTLFSSAYMAEVIRGGLQAIPKGQFEAGDSIGLNYWQEMRLIILPQAMKISIPGIVNTFIGLFKDTTLVIVIGLLDILGVGRSALADAKWNGLSNEVYISIAIFFFICCFSMSRYSIYLENKLHTGHKR